MKSHHALCGLISGLLLLAAGTSHAALILNENFNDYTSSNQPAQQDATGLTINALGNLVDFTKSGFNAVHAVDLGAGNWAPMIYDNNVITLTTAIAANTLGASYSVAFDAGPAAYDSAVQGTDPGDGLLVRILRSDNSVLSSFPYLTGAWAGSETLTPVSFEYIGDGTGDVRLSVSSLITQGNMSGALDNLTIAAVPEPGTALFRVALVGIAAVRRRRAAAV